METPGETTGSFRNRSGKTVVKLLLVTAVFAAGVLFSNEILSQSQNLKQFATTQRIGKVLRIQGTEDEDLADRPQAKTFDDSNNTRFDGTELSKADLSGTDLNKAKLSETQDYPKVGDALVSESEPRNWLTTVETIQLRALESAVVTRNFTGIIAPGKSSDLGFNRIGRIQDLLVDQGDTVKRGDLLASLDTDTLNAEKAVAKADLRAAKARLSELKAGPRKETISAARAKLAELKSLVAYWNTTSDRRMRLVRANAGSQQALDESSSQYRASMSRYDAQLQLVRELESGTRSEQIEAQNAMVEKLIARLGSLEVEIEKSRLVAPYNGIVSKRPADEGTIVAPGTVVLRIVQQESPEAWIGLPVPIVATMELNKSYALKINEQTIEAELTSLLPELDPVTRTQTAVFAMATDSELPRFGQVVRLDWKKEQDSDGFWLPTSALTHGIRGLWSVLVVHQTDKDGQPRSVLERRDVEVLHFESDRVLVRGTVETGDQVVSKGLQKLVPGQQVRIRET